MTINRKTIRGCKQTYNSSCSYSNILTISSFKAFTYISTNYELKLSKDFLENICTGTGTLNLTILGKILPRYIGGGRQVELSLFYTIYWSTFFYHFELKL